MGKASIKQLLQVQSVLFNNAEGIDDVPSDVLQQIIDTPQLSGREFMKFLKNRARLQVISNHTIDTDAAPFIPSGLKEVVEHKGMGQLTFDPSKISLYLSKYQQNGNVIKGNKLRKELKGKLVMNANVLDYLLAHPELIPEEWKGKLVFFWGTIYRSSDGLLCVRCLRWGGDRWYSGFSWLGSGWSDYGPALLCASV